jgi:Cu2+-exporting ATPase
VGEAGEATQACLGFLGVAAALAAHSRHPLSQAIARDADPSVPQPVFDGIVEHPGHGIEGTADGVRWRLGRAGWARHGRQASVSADGCRTVLTGNGEEVAAFFFQDTPREGAARTIAQLRHDGMHIEMLSGDSEAACRDVALALGIDRFRAGLLPAEKVARIADMAQAGRKVLMVGDGLNDAPALGAAHVSMAPATAADVGRNAADFVFLRESLEAVPLAIGVSRQAGRLIRQNIALAIVYNAIAVPIAILGHVTPLIAAVAMSASSVLVIANALRLQGRRAAGGSMMSGEAGGGPEPALAGAQ